MSVDSQLLGVELTIPEYLAENCVYLTGFPLDAQGGIAEMLLAVEFDCFAASPQRGALVVSRDLLEG